MSKKLIIFITIATGIYLFGFFLAGPWLQTEMEKHMPYLIVDPERKVETGCSYDYINYMPIELTGRPESEGIRFPVSKIPTELKDYIHYPERWTSPLNFFNPANQLSQIVQTTLIVLTIIAGVGIVVYLIILWRKGVLKKIKDKMNES